MKKIILIYHVLFADGTTGKDACHEEEVNHEEYMELQQYFEQGNEVMDASLLEDVLPDCYERMYTSILRHTRTADGQVMAKTQSVVEDVVIRGFSI